MLNSRDPLKDGDQTSHVLENLPNTSWISETIDTVTNEAMEILKHPKMLWFDKYKDVNELGLGKPVLSPMSADLIFHH